MPGNGEIVKDVVDQFQKVQAILTSLGVNLTDIDKIKE